MNLKRKSKKQPRSAFKDAMMAVFVGYDDPSNRKPCEVCEALGVLYTKSGTAVECANCQGDGYNWMRRPFDKMWGAFGGTAMGATVKTGERKVSDETKS